MITSALTVGDLFVENDDWVNNDEELQSYFMWFASTYGLKAEKTTGVTHVG